ncbi:MULTISPECIES: glycosyltransferase family 4 protein [Sphingomonas]|uniref:glycosyltransferase family 4 protein n=1 Tax=Sphingomonas TaxID=13687 RepID=UPI0020BEA08A|nr:glycosyltransferase family 4 protein [Sphingomonas faeni]MCK8456761.1 glycosyltransferase family 4 protein [Sphingomonas faeni]
MSRSLLIFQDSPDFGGHEAMFLRFLPALVQSGEFDRIVVRYPTANAKLAERLQPHVSDRFEVRPWVFTKARAEPYLGGFRRAYARAARDAFADLRPATTLLLQGRIENCVVPLLAAPRDAFVVSYVPMAHGMAALGRSAVPGDWVRRRLYRRPDRFIVPSTAVVEQVRAAGGSAPIVVADNIVAPPPVPARAQAREMLGLDPGPRVALFLGRLDVRQKGLDALADAIRRTAARLGDWIFLFVGSGEGEADIERLRHDLAGQVDIRCSRWTDTPHATLAAADLLLMPSRWEGVPLVMLEAMTYRIPILASDIDVFQSYLPSANRVDFAHVDLAGAMARAITPSGIAEYRSHVGARLNDTGLDRSSTRFVEALRPESRAA